MASTMRLLSRNSSGRHSVQPLAISVKVNECAKLPAATSPECDTRSISMKPGMGSFQSANVRIGTLRRSAVGSFRLRRLLATVRMSLNNRSIVAALMFSNFGRIAMVSVRWPLRSSAGTSIGNKALSRLPHTRSEASQSTINAVPRSGDSAEAQAGQWSARAPANAQRVEPIGVGFDCPRNRGSSRSLDLETNNKTQILE